MLPCVRLFKVCGLAVAAACLLLPTASVAQQPGPKPPVLIFLQEAKDVSAVEPQGAAFAFGSGGVETSDYWIGVGCEPVPAVLQAQLKLPEGEGLVVVTVAEDSPAAAAGIQVNDVLLAAADKPLKSVADLVSAVDQAKETEIHIKLLRAGETKTLAVRPAKRPEEAQQPRLPGWPEGMPGPFARAFQWLAPGVVVGQKLFVPKDMSVTITVEHGKPARIAVKKGEKSWEVEQDKLNDLPPEVRGPVQGLLLSMPQLAAGIAPNELGIVVQPFQPGEGAMPRAFRWLQRQPGDAQIEQRLDELKRQIDELQRAVEELSKKQAE